MLNKTEKGSINNNYKVSICVPVYGVEKYIERCSISLFEQTYKNIEYVFVNDCTKDASIDILRKILKRYPDRISQVKIIEHKCNKGLAGARNTAVNEATGDFIIHVDSDDYIEKDTIESLIVKQMSTQADIVSCNAIKHNKGYIEKRKHKTYDSTKSNCLSVIRRDDYVCIWGRLIRTSLYKDNVIKVENGINMGEDYQVICKLIYYSKKTAVLNKFLYHYDCSNISSYSNQFSETKLKQSWRSFDIVKSFFKDKGEEYVHAVQCGEIKIIVAHFIISGKINNGRYYYKEARKRLGNINSVITNTLPFSLRLVLYLSFNYKIMKTYIQISRFLSRQIKH